RLRAGESNLLEKASAENQLLQVKAKRKTLQIQKVLLQQQFAFLLNTDLLLEPKAENIVVKPTFADTAGWTNHPLIKLQQQEENTAKAATRVEQSKLLPDFNIGYNSTTLRDDIRFSGTDRFQSIELG